MREISDAYLLTVAGVSATLIGLFLVGALFYAETGLRRHGEAPGPFEGYLRAGIRITLIVFAIPLGLSLTLVAMEPVWSRALFALLSVVLLAANVDTARRLPAVWRATRSSALLLMEVLTTTGALVLVAVPWVLGGLEPTREDLNWAILLGLAAGFLSISATVMYVFDVARTQTTPSGPWRAPAHVRTARAGRPSPSSIDAASFRYGSTPTLPSAYQARVVSRNTSMARAKLPLVR